MDEKKKLVSSVWTKRRKFILFYSGISWWPGKPGACDRR
jgi:hypothetical protein